MAAIPNIAYDNTQLNHNKSLQGYKGARTKQKGDGNNNTRQFFNLIKSNGAITRKKGAI